MDAFDRILQTTDYTKKILTLETASEQRSQVIWDTHYKFSQEMCQEKLNNMVDEDAEDFMTASVQV